MQINTKMAKIAQPINRPADQQYWAEIQQFENLESDGAKIAFKVVQMKLLAMILLIKN